MREILSIFVEYIRAHEDWLMKRILYYAQKQEYTKYTSTLKEAWRLSISGLSESFCRLIEERQGSIELQVGGDYRSDPAAQFGITEAERHKKRGISLDMFLGLMKYYAQSYRDLINESSFCAEDKQVYCTMLTRFFDRVEISFCMAWTTTEHDQVVSDLQAGNRLMTNEKNKYLTIFESLFMPVFVVDCNGKIENMNLSASNHFFTDPVPGAEYYRENKESVDFGTRFPWLSDDFTDFVKSTERKRIIEAYMNSKNRYYRIYFSRSLDVSGKFSGTIVILDDITLRKRMEQELEKLATTDPLTGAKNRRSFLQLFEQELADDRYFGRLALLMIDIDNFKDINDTYGHDIGDKVLQKLVATSYSVLGTTDTFGRWGGEEFMALLPNLGAEQAITVAERLRHELSTIEITVENSVPIHFTVSIGVTVAADENITSDDVIRKVDKALYMAKNQGRNRVALF